ncbi:single-stranded DNA-binding protein, partial [Clostridioides difficile]
MNQVVLVGRLTRDPELKYIPGTGTAVASFTIAVDRNYINKEGKRDTDFIPIEVIG